MKVYRGSAAAARTYVEADTSRADDYYLAEGTGVATRYVATPDGVSVASAMDGETYEQWVAGIDLATGEAKGRLRTDEKGVRFVEVIVNGPKTWSLAAALHPEIAEAYDAAQERAAQQIIGWLAEHVTTRVGPRGRQVQVPVEELEAAVVRHYTSRAGDPHRHLHLQVNARVRAAGGWRAIHTVGVRDSLDAINGMGHAAVMTDPQFRAVLAAHGYTLNPETGEVAELAKYVGAFSARAAQIGRNVERYEADWRTDHPDQEPGPGLRQVWDRRAWAQARPDKPTPTSGSHEGVDVAARWLEELHDLGVCAPDQPVALLATRPGEVDRDLVVATAVTRLGARRSAWNAADARGEVERLIAATGLVTTAGARAELAKDLTARIVESCLPIMDRHDVPEHVRAWTSPGVVAVEDDLADRLAARDQNVGGLSVKVPAGLAGGLSAEQVQVVSHLAGRRRLTVVEGAAGAGKTTTLAATRDLLQAQGRGMVVVTPTKKAAQVAADQIGAPAHSAAWLLHQWGYRWDTDGRWGRVAATPVPEAVLDRGDLLLVDEAGMLDQDTARGLLELADTLKLRVALVGDRHQLPAVGRGGVLDLAAAHAPDAWVTLTEVHRFSDPDYTALTMDMRTGHAADQTFDDLLAQGQIVIHPTHAARLASVAALGSGQSPPLVIADTNEQVAHLNALIRDSRLSTTRARAGSAMVTGAGEHIGLGDRITTRRNDNSLGVANRETWTVTGLDDHGWLQVTDPAHTNRVRTLPPGYVAAHVELAYATTVYGAQGDTVDHAHLLMGEHTGAASAYVAMTRGRHTNTAHMVADDVDDAREQWIDVFARDRADLGPTHAALLALEDIERYGPTAAPHIAGDDLVRAPQRHEDYHRATTTTPDRSAPSW